MEKIIMLTRIIETTFCSKNDLFRQKVTLTGMKENLL